MVLVMEMEMGGWKGNGGDVVRFGVGRDVVMRRRVYADRWVRYWIVASVMSAISRGVSA